MKNFLIAFTVFLVWSFFGLWLYSWFQTEDQLSVIGNELAENIAVDTSEISSKKNEIELKNPEVTAVLDTISKTDTLSTNNEVKLSGLKGVTGDGDLIFMFPDGVSILENSNEIFIPETITDFKYKTNTYLSEHPNTEIHINSLYSASENFESPNLGIQRGKKIKEALLSVGVPKERIVIKPIIKGIDFDAEGFYSNSISITFKPLDLERVNNLKTELPETKTVYPRFSNSGILINKNLKDLLAEVKEIVNDHPEIKIELIGHTDNIGNDVDNYKMALNYAKQVEWYLVAKNGIRNSMIKASSKGEENPIEDNSYRQGRIANRRIEVVFY